VGVHGVDVEQVVLHASDDVAEGRNISGQHPVAVHAPHLRGDAGRLAQDLHEQAAGADVQSQVVVEPGQIGADLADGAGAYPLELRVGLHQVEQLQNGHRQVLEKGLGGGLQIAVSGLKALVDGDRRVQVALEDDRLLEQLQQHLIEPVQPGGGAVVTLHQLLHRQVVAMVAVAELGRQAALVVQQQPVFAAAGEAVQAVADLPQQRLPLHQVPVFGLGEKAARD